MRRTSLLSWLLLTSSVAVASDSLQELVVTATRRPEPRLDIAASLTPIDTADIARTGATHHADLLNRVAGVYVQRGSGQESLTAIRSPVLTGPGSCGAFLAMEDGLSIRPIGFCNVNDFFEINTEQAGSVEIIRGPGPAIYGASAVHGIVNVRTPDVDALPRASLALEGGSYDYRRARFSTRTQLAETGLAAYGVYTDDGGFRADSGFEEAKLNVLADRPLAGGALRVRMAGTKLEQETAGFVQGFESYKTSLARGNANPEAYRDASALRASAAWERAQCDDCIDDVRAIVRHSEMDFLQHFLLGKPVEENEQTSAALSTTFGRPLNESWVYRLGADLEASDTSLLENQEGPTTDGAPAANAIRPAGKHYDYGVAGLTLGGHATLEWRATSRLAVAAGLRIERTRYDYDNHMLVGNTDENGVPCGAGGCLYSRPADRVDTFDNVAPKLEARFKLSERQRLYASWARGFRPPEMTELYRLQRQQTIADLDSEQLDSAEIGWRGTVDSFTWSLAAFALDKRHVILRDSSGFNISNGETTHRGIEYEAAWSFSPTWRVSANGTFARHEYAFDASIEGGETIRDGNDVDTAPRQVHALRLGWQPYASVDAELEISHLGEYFLDAANAHRYGGHTLVNLRVGMDLSAAWRVSARLQNLADTDYADRADFAFGQYRYFPGRGRSAFLEIAYRTK